MPTLTVRISAGNVGVLTPMKIEEKVKGVQYVKDGYWAVPANLRPSGWETWEVLEPEDDSYAPAEPATVVVVSESEPPAKAETIKDILGEFPACIAPFYMAVLQRHQAALESKKELLQILRSSSLLLVQIDTELAERIEANK